MSAPQDPINEMITSLKQQRDELKLKMHLAEAEAKDEFEAATDKLDKLTEEFEPLKEAVAECTENVAESMKLVAEEVLTSFDRIRKAL